MAKKAKRLRLASAIGLCYRCEHRALFLEAEHLGGQHYRPRSECGDVPLTVHSCYMYRPTRAVKLRRNYGDRRPINAPACLAARCHATGLV
jgi:hypothetical protein